MEEKKGKAVRKFRGKEAILKLLQQQAQSSQSIKSFCVAHGISDATFHNWKTRYGSAPLKGAAGFAALQIIPEPGLFAIVGNIRIYQPVSATYLKELLS